MPIYGTHPLDSDNAEIAFGGIVVSLVKSVNFHNAKEPNPKVRENTVLAPLYALKCLCEGSEIARKVIAKEQVAEWRDRFIAWLEASRKRLPKKYVDGYEAEALRLFEELESLASTRPRVAWVTDADTLI